MKTIHETNQYRLATTGEQVMIQGLVSAAQHNGKLGVVVNYDKDSGRYGVKLLPSAKDDTTKKKHQQLAVKPGNILLLDDPKKKEWDDRLVHVFIPCHTGDNRRHEQFRQCIRSLAVQTGRCRIFVGVSGGDEIMRQKAMHSLRTAATLPVPAGCHHQWFVVEETDKPRNKSQFQHFKSLLPISMVLNPYAWLMFLDNDDMYHPVRIQFFQEQAKKYKDDTTTDGCFSGGKLLIDDNKVRKKWGDVQVPQLELFLHLDSSLDGIVDVAATEHENYEKDVTEYFDFCLRSTVLKKFISLTPDGILSHRFCDVRFCECIGKLEIKVCDHPALEWLLMHYRIRHSDRHQLFLQKDTTSRNNAMVSVTISDADRELSDETGLPVELIVFCRKDIEEGAIQMIERDDEGLEHRRKMAVPRMDRDFGHGIGSRIWEETCRNFSSYFEPESARKNRQWCAATNPHRYDLEEDLISGIEKKHFY